MGLLSWLFPSPADRVRRARRYLERGNAADARLEVLDLDDPEAVAVLHEAENALALDNLDAAVSWARAGDDHRVVVHLELAEQFHHGGHEERFRAARREMREIRAARSEEEARLEEEEQARLLQVDPLGFSGGPGFLEAGRGSDELLASDREELEARLALLVENYPEELRARVTELGFPFARAVLDLDEGRADLALQTLLECPDDEPLVQWERARAAHALGDPTAAARAVKRFAELAAGHHAIGRMHSGVYLAQLLAESGQVPEALRVLRAVRAREPKQGGVLFAQLLEAVGQLDEAEAVLKALIRDNPRQNAFYVLLARVRLKGDHPVEAARALEASLEATDCTPGRCGAQPPSLEVHRMLATIYLEHDLEHERALALADTAASLVQQPTWDDAYLAALAARRRRDPEGERIAAMLHERTPDGDPRRERLQRFLPAPA